MSWVTWLQCWHNVMKMEWWITIDLKPARNYSLSQVALQGLDVLYYIRLQVISFTCINTELSSFLHLSVDWAYITHLTLDTRLPFFSCVHQRDQEACGRGYIYSSQCFPEYCFSAYGANTLKRKQNLATITCPATIKVCITVSSFTQLDTKIDSSDSKVQYFTQHTMEHNVM